MKKYLNNFIKKVISILLTQESGNNFNNSIYKFKNKYKWIFRFRYGTANDVEILDIILQKLDGKFDILMVHSSLNEMVPMYIGSPNKLLSLLISYCKKNNITLAAPTFFSGSNWEAKEYYENGKHIFDVNKSFSQMGILTELLRRTPDVKRSIHPTHSICALGPLADELTGTHHLSDSTFGQGTPFSTVLKYRTIILGIGTRSPQPLTQVNAAPDIMKTEFPIDLYSGVIPVTCVNQIGEKLIYNLKIRKKEFKIDRVKVKKMLNGKVKEWKYKGIPFLIAQADIVNQTVIDAAKNNESIYKRVK